MLNKYVSGIVFHGKGVSSHRLYLPLVGSIGNILKLEDALFVLSVGAFFYQCRYSILTAKTERLFAAGHNSILYTCRCRRLYWFKRFLCWSICPSVEYSFYSNVLYSFSLYILCCTLMHSTFVLVRGSQYICNTTSTNITAVGRR